MSKDSTIISVSMKPEDIEVLEAIQEETGIKSRSEVMRKALQSLHSDIKSVGEEGILVVIHEGSSNTALIEAQHEFPSTIKSHSHQCKGSRCVETYTVKGENAPELFKRLQNVRSVVAVKAVWF